MRGGRERERERLTTASDTGVTPAQLQMELKQVREVVDHLQEKVRDCLLPARSCTCSPQAWCRLLDIGAN
jgi:hypothetical protein